jgi:type II secretory pathway component PulF
MRYRYHAFDRAGKVRTETIEAAGPAEATEQLRREGLFVSEIAPEAKGGVPAATRGIGSGGGRLTLVAAFMRHLAVLVSTGTPLVEALAALERQARDERWRAVIADIRSRVEDGSPFSDALAAHPRHFDTVCRSLVRAGESGGKLDAMLRRLADLTRQQVRMRQSLIGAMIYPCLLIVVAVSVMSVMMMFVMPRFTGLFKTLDAPLPPTTKALMAVSEFLRGYWWAVAGSLAAIVAGGVVWLKTDAGRRRFAGLMVRAPQLGRVTRSLLTARFARIMGVLLESKVPMLECLALTRDAIPHPEYADLLRRAEDALTRGESFSAAISGGNLVSPSVCEAIRNAERTGQVGPVLTSMADFLDEENEVVVKSLTSLIEPLILITLGLVVGFVAISMFLPLFDLTATAGPGGGGGAAP